MKRKVKWTITNYPLTMPKTKEDINLSWEVNMRGNTGEQLYKSMKLRLGHTETGRVLKVPQVFVPFYIKELIKNLILDLIKQENQTIRLSDKEGVLDV